MKMEEKTVVSNSTAADGHTYWYFIGYIFPLLAGCLFVRRYIKRSKRGCWPRDTVIVHDIGPGPHVPSLSPFPLKLQTFLRMAKIPYQVDHKSGFSSKGKIPWITYNDQDVADSQFALEFCKDQFGVDLNKHLSDEQKAVGRAFQKLTEENLYWTMCAVTFGDDLEPLQRLLPYKGLKMFLTSRLLKFFIWRQMRGHGIGRHTREEILHIGHGDLQALSSFLGEKCYLLGDTPTEADSALFGMLAQITWHMPDSPHYYWMKNEFPNLLRYCERIKQEYWPDWDTLTASGAHDHQSRDLRSVGEKLDKSVDVKTDTHS